MPCQCFGINFYAKHPPHIFCLTTATVDGNAKGLNSMGIEFWLNVWRQEVLWGLVELLGFILVYDGWQRCYFAFGSWWDTAEWSAGTEC